MLIKVFTTNDWTVANATPSPEYMLDLLHGVQKCWETHKCPITVVCRYVNKYLVQWGTLTNAKISCVCNDVLTIKANLFFLNLFWICDIIDRRF